LCQHVAEAGVGCLQQHFQGHVDVTIPGQRIEQQRRAEDACVQVAVVVANIRQFKLTRQEWFALLYVAIALVVGIAIYLLTR
jgi:hypothetical protein